MSTSLLIDSNRNLPDAAGEFLRRLGGPAVAVYRWLLWRYNDATGQLNPSHVDIAKGTGFSVTTVRRALERLREFGLLEWTGEARGSGKGRKSNRYHLTSRENVWSVVGEDPASKSSRPDVQTDPDQTVRENEGTTAKGKEEEKKQKQIDFDFHLNRVVTRAICKALSEHKEQQRLLADLRNQVETSSGSLRAQTERQIERLEAVATPAMAMAA